MMTISFLQHPLNQERNNILNEQAIIKHGNGKELHKIKTNKQTTKTITQEKYNIITIITRKRFLSNQVTNWNGKNQNNVSIKLRKYMPTMMKKVKYIMKQKN